MYNGAPLGHVTPKAASMLFPRATSNTAVRCVQTYFGPPIVAELPASAIAPAIIGAAALVPPIPTQPPSGPLNTATGVLTLASAEMSVSARPDAHATCASQLGAGT